MLKRGLEVVGDFLSQHVGRGEIVGVFEALVFEPEDVEVHFVALGEIVVAERAPAAVRVLIGVPRRLAKVPLARPVAFDELIEIGALEVVKLKPID
jgi:hypothetical protein